MPPGMENRWEGGTGKKPLWGVWLFVGTTLSRLKINKNVCNYSVQRKSCVINWG